MSKFHYFHLLHIWFTSTARSGREWLRANLWMPRGAKKTPWFKHVHIFAYVLSDDIIVSSIPFMCSILAWLFHICFNIIYWFCIFSMTTVAITVLFVFLWCLHLVTPEIQQDGCFKSLNQNLRWNEKRDVWLGWAAQLGKFGGSGMGRMNSGYEPDNERERRQSQKKMGEGATYSRNA